VTQIVKTTVILKINSTTCHQDIHREDIMFSKSLLVYLCIKI